MGATAARTSSSLTGAHVDGSKLGIGARLRPARDLRAAVALRLPGSLACERVKLLSSSSSTGNPALARAPLNRWSTFPGSAQNLS